jgi:hypothetical protein
MQQRFNMPNISKLLIVIVILVLFSIFYFLFSPVAHAQSNIDATNSWAWNDAINWVDFRYSGNPNVNVTSTALEGYASSSVGFISLNCASGPPGSNCTVPYNVVNTNGTLSGWAWSDQIGWISFNCNNPGIGDTCATSDYKVTIVSGEFTGWAWNDIIGWISFNCNNTGIGDTCTTVDYKVQTTWGAGSQTGNLISNIFDTNDSDGVAVNTIMWQGTLNSGDVKFQIASSDSSGGPWNFKGPDGSDTTHYGSGSGPNIQTKINLGDHNNKRYFRYKVFIESDAGGSQTPQVDDIIIGYSP